MDINNTTVKQMLFVTSSLKYHTKTTVQIHCIKLDLLVLNEFPYAFLCIRYSKKKKKTEFKSFFQAQCGNNH